MSIITEENIQTVTRVLSSLGGSVYSVVTTDWKGTVPIDPANTDYAEIMRQVDAGTLTIKDAD